MALRCLPEVMQSHELLASVDLKNQHITSKVVPATDASIEGKNVLNNAEE